MVVRDSLMEGRVETFGHVGHEGHMRLRRVAGKRVALQGPRKERVEDLSGDGVRGPPAVERALGPHGRVWKPACVK